MVLHCAHMAYTTHTHVRLVHRPMNPYHQPHPDIEDHYHIRELIEGQERRTADRAHHQDRVKLAYERDEDIRVAKGKEIKAFWCCTCNTDFISEAFKEVEVDWTNSTQHVAFYRAKCPRGHWCMRHITDIFKDAYWTKSRFAHKDRGEHTADTLQPSETGFNLLYKKI